MAKHTITQVLDDIDGTEDAQTVPYSFNGVDYEIDLAEHNRKDMENAFSKYIAASRRVGGRATTRRAAATTSRTPSLATQKGYSTAEIREWANANGHQLSDRGRIPNDIVESYDAFRSAPAPEAPPKRARRAPAKAKEAASA